MNMFRQLSNSTLVLLLCIVLGCMAGAWAQPVAAVAYSVGQIYLALIGMAAVPLLVVAIFFGLRQLLGVARPGRRIGMMFALAVALVVLCAFIGVFVGTMGAPGLGLSDVDHAQLGHIILQSTGDAQEMRLNLFGHADASSATSLFALKEFVPDNFYRVLADGHALGILTGAILFGMAFASLSTDQSKMLHGVFESIYRSFESIIEYANLLLPVLVFGTAAHWVEHIGRSTLVAMSGFLTCFIASAFALCAVAFAVIATRAHTPLSQVFSSLKAPMLVGLTSGSATATIPHAIEAMSARLGFSRGVAELVVPFGAVFVRAGSALYFAIVAVFAANLYGRPLGAGDLAMIGLAATAAAFLSAGQNGIAGAAYAGFVLSLLQLPSEAVVVVFVVIDLICEGPRNLLSLLSVCLVVALVSAGLPAERSAPLRDAELEPGQAALYQFAFTRGQLALAAGCVAMAASLIVLMGIGVGAK